MSNPVVFITGSSTGFGRLIAVTLARRGYDVFASMRDVAGRNRAHAADLETLAQQENLRLRVIEMDVSDNSAVQNAVDRVTHEAATIDIVINNAGIAYWGLVETFTIEQAKTIFETNFFGPLRVNRAVLPHMRERRSGLLMHMSSAAGRLVIPSMGIYSATKFALEAMAETLRYEVSQFGIDCITVEPGPYPTAIFGKAEQPVDRARAAEYGALAQIPEQVRHGLESYPADSQEVANKVVELIEMPAGTRPVRTLVGSFVEHFRAVNDTALEMQTAAMQNFGFLELMTLQKSARQVA